MRIAVDAMGGDFAPHEIVKGVIKAAHDFKDKGVEIILVGNKPLLFVMAGDQLEKLNISVIDASQNIKFHEHSMEALRHKPHSSIAVGINLIKEGKADAFVSAGPTGAVFGAAILSLGKIGWVERPAIASIINLSHSMVPFLLIDCGANADCRPSHLLQFARMDSLYANRIFGIESPRVGLFSSGGEDTKGNKLTVESHQLLRQSSLNFIGNIEGNDLAENKADVIVTDGFTGNAVLKTLEGVGESLIKLRPRHGTRVGGSHRVTGQALSADAGLDFFIKGMDYSEYGGACLLGVKGNVFISHGRSRAKAIKNAIWLANQTAKYGICHLLAEAKHE